MKLMSEWRNQTLNKGDRLNIPHNSLNDPNGSGFNVSERWIEGLNNKSTVHVKPVSRSPI
jgi:hypothetical protein